MQVAAIGFVITRRCFDVLDLVLIGQGDAIDTAYPVALGIGGIGQVDPNRLGAREVVAGLDVDLAKPAVLQHKYINQKALLAATRAAWTAACCQQSANCQGTRL